MGAEQSARLACTETGATEKPLRLINSELFFRLYFDKMREPVTGPVTEALLHLVKNLPKDRAILNEVAAHHGEVERMEYSDNESGFSSDSTVTTGGYYDDVDIEPIQIAEFDSMDEYDISPPDSLDIIADRLPNFGPVE
ncbi:hypothetical protein KR067_000927 [Drosophila pandora]|nr:hypothetical protein KR067_000927 [Drosophila pandora]